MTNRSSMISFGCILVKHVLDSEGNVLLEGGEALNILTLNLTFSNLILWLEGESLHAQPSYISCVGAHGRT